MIEYTNGGVINKWITKTKVEIWGFQWTKQGLSERKTPFDAIVQILDGETEVTINASTPSKKVCIIMPANILRGWTL